MTNDRSDVSIEVESVPLLPGQWELLLVVVAASVTNVSLVFFLTSLLNTMAGWEWSNTLLWPPEIYIAGLIGGIIGGVLAFFEIKKGLERKSELKPGTLIASDLFYIIGILGLVYFLSFLSESYILQGVIWVIVVLWFTVFAQNVIKIIWQGNGFQSDVSPE